MSIDNEFRSRAYAAEATVRKLTMLVGALVHETERQGPDMGAASFHANVCQIGSKMTSIVEEG